MMNNNTDTLLKSQHIERRKNVYTVQGNMALKSIEQIHQKPAPKKRLPAPAPAPEKFRRAHRYEDNDESVRNVPLPSHVSVIKNRFFTPELIILYICLAALAVFCYYALLWRDDGMALNLRSDAATRKKMLAYALSSEVEHLPPPESMPLAVNETFSWNNYTVKKGDSVSKIAADNGLSLDAIIASNNLRNARLLREGDVLRIPNMDGIPYTVVKGDSYQKIADRMNVALEAILDANDIQDDNINIGDILFLPGARMRSDDLKMALGELFTYPVRGRLSSPFGWRKDPFTGQRRYHSAIDLAANTGTPVKAAADGKVTSVAYSSVFGNYIIITHGGGFQSMYAHLNSTSVKEGARVTQGVKIGAVGNTGRSTGSHLHFAIYKNGRAVNPLEYVKY
ncbi:MAG: M23 family metallopeptidase [Spirochaetaceae bacterium]|jgi:murein DD-endopeptidase MepM/ murein hydrolase activator NlpD|nr:M23 family metallopeptidase [Spirochaetaceae bacterium]